MNRRDAIKMGSLAGIAGITQPTVALNRKDSSPISLISECLSSCGECYHECLTSDRLNDPSYKRCLEASLDCMTFCRTLLELVSRQSPFTSHFVAICIEACERCIEACQMHEQVNTCMKCIEACRRCIEACRELN